MRRRWMLHGLVSITLLSILIGLGFRFGWWRIFADPDKGAWPWIEAMSWLIGMTTGLLSVSSARSVRPAATLPAPSTAVVNTPARDTSLLDRDNEYDCLRALLGQDQPPGVVLVYGLAGFGKTKFIDTVLDDIRHDQDRHVTAHRHAAFPGCRLDARTLISDLEGKDRAVELEPGETRRNRLLLALSDTRLTQTVIVIENAEHLAVPGGQQLDLQLDEALETIFQHRDPHRVTVLLVSRAALQSPGRRLWATEAPISIGKLPPPDFTTFLKTRHRNLAELSEARLNLLYDRLNGNPRCAQLMIAVVDLSSYGLGMDVLAEQIAKLNPRDMPRRLAELLGENLNGLHRKVIQALAAFAAPVDAAAIAAIINPPVNEAAVTGTLLRFLNFELVQSSGNAWALTFDETDCFLPTDTAEHAALLRNAAAQLKARRHPDPQSMNDLQGHLAYLSVLLTASRYSVAYSAMIPITEVLKRWNSNHLLLTQREKIREQIGVPEFEMLNDNELGDAYAIVGDFKKASLVYGTALTAANQLGNANIRTTIRYNFATCYWQSGRADLAYNYYLDAFRDAEQHHQVIWQAAALGLAECHRRWGEYDRAFSYIDRIPYPSMSAPLLLRVARWRVETGSTNQARNLITRAREASRGNDWQLAACHEAQADLLLADGDLAGARIEATLALEQAVQAHNAVVLLLARTTLCWVELMNGDLNSAREHIEEAEHYRPAGSALVVVALNALLHQQSDPGLARRLFNTLESEARERIVDEKDRGAHDMLGFAICGQTSRPDQAIRYFDTTLNGPSVLRTRRNLLVERLDTYASPAGALRPMLEILSDNRSRTAD